MSMSYTISRRSFGRRIPFQTSARRHLVSLFENPGLYLSKFRAFASRAFKYQYALDEMSPRTRLLEGSFGEAGHKK